MLNLVIAWNIWTKYFNWSWAMDFSWDYKNVDLNDDGINELIIFNNDQGNKSAKLNIFQIQNSNGTLEFQTSNSISFPSHVIAYFDVKKLSQEKFLFTPSQFIDEWMFRSNLCTYR